MDGRHSINAHMVEPDEVFLITNRDKRKRSLRFYVVARWIYFVRYAEGGIP